MEIPQNSVPIKPRIAYVVTKLNRGGCEVHLLEILPKLQKWFSVHVFIFDDDYGTLAPSFEEQGIKLTCLLPPEASRYGRLRRWIKGILSLRTQLSSGVDILHAFLPIAYCGSGVVYILNRSETIKHFLMSRRSLNEYARHRYLLQRLEKFLHRHLCLALGNSSEVSRQLIEEGIPGYKVHQIFNGIPLAF